MAAADVMLTAVQDPFVAALLGVRAHARRVGTAFGFGQGKAGFQFAGGKTAQEFFFLFRRAVARDRHRRHTT